METINSYHGREFKAISDLELTRIVKSIFASSQLRNEFIKELELGCGYDDNTDYDEDNCYNDCDGDGDEDGDDEEYF